MVLGNMVEDTAYKFKGLAGFFQIAIVNNKALWARARFALLFNVPFELLSKAV